MRPIGAEEAKVNHNTLCLLTSQLIGGGRGCWTDEELIDGVKKLQGENAKLRDAIRRAGFAVMETSGDWSIHDVSEYGKAEEAKCLEVATENAHLKAACRRLLKAFDPPSKLSDSLIREETDEIRVLLNDSQH